jgi:hypothetical protein
MRRGDGRRFATLALQMTFNLVGGDVRVERHVSRKVQVQHFGRRRRLAGGRLAGWLRRSVEHLDLFIIFICNIVGL